jgi:hypothetical protein
MKTRALLFALPLLALGGCRDNRASVTIHGICDPPATCSFTGTCDAFSLTVPTIDATTSTSGRLKVYVEVENQLPDNGKADTFRTNTNDAHVDEIVLTYQGIALPRQVIGTQSLIPTAGTSVVAVELIPASLNALATLGAYAPTVTPREMTAVLKLGGYWDDGSRWETGEFPVAIRVCSGCVPSCADPASTCPPSSNGQLPIECL